MSESVRSLLWTRQSHFLWAQFLFPTAPSDLSLFHLMITTKMIARGNMSASVNENAIETASAIETGREKGDCLGEVLVVEEASADETVLTDAG